MKLTDPQKTALEWLPERLERPGRVYGGAIFGSPPKGALKALANRGLAQKVGHPETDIWHITETGVSVRSALRAEGDGE